MFEKLFQYFENKFPLSAEEKALAVKLFIPKKLLKGEFLQREGEVARYGAFVASGIIRSYIIDQKGKEYIMQFAPENWWISDKAGMSGEPASFFIDAIEDSDLLLADAKAHGALMQMGQGYSASFQAGIQKRAVAKDKRIVHALASTAEERYHDFLESYPSIAQRIPQHMLASYLGITPETLSRIRKSLSRKK